MLWLLLGYAFLFIHRPFEVQGWEFLADIHLERIYMLAMLLAVAGWPGKRWPANRLHWAIGGFALAVVLCWLVSPWAAFGEKTVEDFFKILVFYGLLVVVVHDEKDLKKLLAGFLVIMGVYVAHSLWEYGNGRHVYRMSIPRMIGVDQTMGDPNSFGATIVYALPFVLPFWTDPQSRRYRWLLAGYAGLSILCIGLTGSRSAFVSLVLAALMVILRSRGRWRLAVLGMMAAPLLFILLPASLQTRFETIVNPEVGPANAQVSAEGRLEGLRIGVKLWEDNPLTGVGPGAWRPASRSPLESHNLYGQLMGEMGILGIVAFGALLLAFWMNLRWVRKVYQLHPEWRHDFLYQVAHVIGLSVILLLFEGNFGHNLFRYSWYWYAAFLVITRRCVQQRLYQQMLWEEYAPPAEESLVISH